MSRGAAGTMGTMWVNQRVLAISRKAPRPKERRAEAEARRWEVVLGLGRG